jgi:hydroxyethylthiazole kinase-like uncharacterized protein yjeF
MQELLEKLERSSDSHKGQNGKVLVIAGSSKYTGAPALVAKAALRSGADLVKILTAEDAKPVVQSFSENLIVESYGDLFGESSLQKAKELEAWADVTVIGPGLSDASEEAVKIFGEQVSKLIVDAEAIEPLQGTSANIFTPHSGEAKALEQNYDSVKSFAHEKSNTVLLKGKIDRIYSLEKVFENETGCAGMTVGGTGDVLAGIVASFKSQGLDDVESSRLAAYVNGKAGEKAFDDYGNGLVATDIIEMIPEIIKN